MNTNARRDRVLILLDGAESYVAYRDAHQLRIHSHQRSAIANILSALASAPHEDVQVNVADLDCVYYMWRSNNRIHAGPFKKFLLTHSVASLITGLMFPFWLGPHFLLLAPFLVGWLVYLYLPVVGLLYLRSGPGSDEWLLLVLSIAAARPYALSFCPSWYVARHILTGRRADWAYGVIILLLTLNWSRLILSR
ncbi:MAG: hypothetical protein JNL58_28530 [Planctomyces sp.]|nr:hypothetical protein [Planctomyces sp.]